MPDTTTPTADDTSSAPELTQPEQDALMSAQDGVDGTLTSNSPMEESKDDAAKDSPDESNETGDSASDNVDEEEETSDSSDSNKEDSDVAGKDNEADIEPAPELKTEKDEAGVFAEPKTEDPGDYKPSDYTFEIRTTDGKTHKISSPEEADAFAAELDEHPELVSASQYTAFNRYTAKMDIGMEADKKAYDQNKEKFDAEQALVETRETTLNQWSNEINYLANNGDLPKISDEMNSADWSNPEVAKDPAVKARLEVFKWMESENEKRLAANLEPIRSVIDAHTAMELETMKQNQAQEVSREKTQRQKKGSMIGGPSSFTPDNIPQNTIIGPGGSLDDVISDYMNQ